jgi:nucleoside-diphosphate kinase
LERTLAILKPDCVRKNLIGKVISHIESAGFKIVAMKMLKLTPEQAGLFIMSIAKGISITIS